MQGVSITNFKSYRRHSIFGFNPYLNVILGGNGQGKSNIFKALSYALSDRLQINRTEFRNCLHRGFDANEEKEIEVEVMMREKGPSEQQLVKVAKVWKPTLVQECYINSKLTHKKQYENFVDSLSLGYTNPYNLIQQGKINQITLMDEFQLYRLLEEITGVKKFIKRKEEALAIMKKVELEKSETKGILEELDSKLRSLENRKEEFQFFAVEEKTKKYRTKKHLDELLESTRHNLENIKTQYNQITDGLAKIIFKKKNIEQSIEQAHFFIKVSKEKLAMADRSVQGDTQPAETQQLRDLQRKQKQLHKQLKEKAKQIKQKDKEVENFKKHFAQIEQKYENMKLNRQLNKPREDKSKMVLAFDSQIKMEEQRMKQIEEQKKNIQDKVKEIQKVLKVKKNMENLQQCQKIQGQLDEIKQKRSENKKMGAQLAWQRNVTSIQSESLKEVVQQAEIKMRKVLPFLDFNLLAYLKQHNVRGVYGYFIEFVKIDESVGFAYEIAGMTKLCSLLVENQEACTAVIEANRKLKGRHINIIQLDYVRARPAQSQALPKSQKANKLSNSKWIKINTKALQHLPKQLDQDIEKLIKNTFDRHALVKDYETGLRVSKQFHLNCITGDREIVYAEGYHCKLGQESVYHENNLQLFYKYQDKQQGYLKKMEEKKQLEAKILEGQNQEVSLANAESRLQIQLQKVLFSANQLKTQTKMLEIYLKNIEQLSKNLRDSQASLKKKRETLQLLASNSKTRQTSKMSKAECQQIEHIYQSRRKQLNKMLTAIYQIQEIIQKLTAEKQLVDNEVIKGKNSKEMGFVSAGAMVSQIQGSLEQKQKEVKDWERELEELNKIEKDIEGNKNHVEVKLITYRSEEQDIMARLGEIGEFQENVEQLEELSNSMSVSMLHGKKRNHHFSTKDRLLFTKFGNILENFKENKKMFKDLEEAEEKIKAKITQYDQQSDQYMSEVAQKFQNEFKQIFSFLVNQGHSQVRLKKVSQKIKDTIKYKNCLTIKVSFSSSAQAMKKWNDFSGGQKTVIAISMILALQRCQPAPFYVLDEIDSALDSVFVQKIAELLARESQRNKCQYFISSFKQDMLNFPEEICNYYLVTSENRQSSIEKISQHRAIQALKSIVMKV